MKKIISGKKYDTDTAKKIGERSYGQWGDLHHFVEKLYLKKTGEFFIHGEGGAMSKYSKQTGDNSWSGSEAIIPLSYRSAAEWAEAHMGADDYEKYFGEVSEDDTKRQICISITEMAADKIKKEAQRRETSVSDLVEKLIMDL